MVVPVGQFISGVLHGLAQASFTVPVVGVVVGADPAKRLDEWAPAHWHNLCKLWPQPNPPASTVPAGGFFSHYNKAAVASVAADLRLAARACDKFASLRFEVAEIAAKTKTRTPPGEDNPAERAAVRISALTDRHPPSGR